MPAAVEKRDAKNDPVTQEAFLMDHFNLLAPETRTKHCFRAFPTVPVLPCHAREKGWLRWLGHSSF